MCTLASPLLPHLNAYLLGAPDPQPSALCTRGAGTPPEVLLHRDSLLGTQAALSPSLELVSGLSLLLSGAANKDLRTGLFMGRKPPKD